MITRLRDYTRSSSSSSGQVEGEKKSFLVNMTGEEEDEESEKENDSAFNILTLEIESMKNKSVSSTANPPMKRKLLGNSANFAPLIVEEMLDYTVE